MNVLIRKNLQPTIQTVVPAGIAGTQRPRMVRAYHIHASWMPATHAGMTDKLKLLANQDEC